MTPEQFRQIGYQIVNWIADYRENVGELPVQSQVQPGDIRAQLPSEPPQVADSADFAAILSDLNNILLPGVTHWHHPNWFGYFPANSRLASVLGDFLSSGLAPIGLNWQASPALTELEEVVMGWMRQMLGLSDAWHGVIQNTASVSTLVALLCARERASNHEQTRGGMQRVDKPLVVYTSPQSHSSVKKAALLAGYGLEHVRAVPVDKAFALRADKLAEMIAADAAAGLQPCAVVATVGTTATTAIDPVAAIAALTSEHNLWLHVDCAMAGTAMILPECRWMWDGIESADSLVLNPHKWLGVVFDCSLYYVRDTQHLIRVMSTNPSYLQTAADDSAANYRNWGIPLGRRFRALKLWCLIREMGVSGLQAAIRDDIADAQWLREQIESAENWHIIAPVPLQTLCVIHTPPDLSGEALDAHTLGWVNRINQSGDYYLTPAKINDRWIVRVSLGNETTTRDHVAALWQRMQAEAETG